MGRRRKAEDALLEFLITAPFAIAGDLIAEGQRQSQIMQREPLSATGSGRAPQCSRWP